MDPDVILYDEPTTGLDPIRSDIINELVLKLKWEMFFFFFMDTATTEIYTNLNTLSLHDALPILSAAAFPSVFSIACCIAILHPPRSEEHTSELQSHSEISYAVFCLKKKKQT